jgi:hypothetical protein
MTTEANAPAPIIVDLNLLPTQLRPAQVSGFALLVAAVLALLLLAAVPLAFRATDARAQANDAQQLQRDAEVELGALEAELSQGRALKLEAEAALLEWQAFEDERDFLQGGARPLHEDLFWLYGFGFLPAGARITGITASEDGFSVDGTATGALDGIAYAQKLVEQGGFESARMTSFAPGDRTAGAFTVEVVR